MKNQNILDFFKSVFGLFLLGFWVYGMIICLSLLFFGNNQTKVLLVLLLPYQYYFCKRSKWFIQLILWLKPFDFLKSYNIIVEDGQELKNEKCIFAVHPHGITSIGANILLWDHRWQKIQTSILVSRVALYNPWGGLSQLLMGTLSVDPISLQKYMKQGRNMIILPGSFEEASLMRYDKDNIFVQNRKGFIKYCLRNGYNLYPCYSFGEKKLYHVYSNKTLAMFLNKFKIPGMFACGSFLVYPHTDVDVTVVVGKPIKCPKIEKPNDEDVHQYHSLFVSEIERIYYQFGPSHGSKQKLEIN